MRDPVAKKRAAKKKDLDSENTHREGVTKESLQAQIPPCLQTVIHSNPLSYKNPRTAITFPGLSFLHVVVILLSRCT